MPRIVVGVDGSESSRVALDAALDEAAMRGAQLEVVTVASPAVGNAAWYGYPPENDEPFVTAAREATQSFLEKTLADRKSDVPGDVKVTALSGIPAAELIELSEGADLLVVGSRGAGGFRRLVLGSVSSAVVHHAHCPVLVTPASSAG